jgi:nitric oxide reductase NorD protein
MSVRVQQRLQVLTNNDRAAYDALQEAMPDLAARFSEERDMADLADLLCQVSAEAPDCTLALIERLGSLPPLSIANLRKWAFHGLQRYRREPVKRLGHFQLGDPLAFSAGEATTDAEHLLAKRDELLHYLSGFGFSEHRLELHEPRASGSPLQCPTIGTDLLLFPRTFAAGAHSRERLYRAAVAHAAAHLQFSVQARPAGNRSPMLVAVLSLIEDARIERLMAQRYPGLNALWGLFHIATRENAGFDFAGLAARLARALHEPGYSDTNAWVIKGRRLFEEAAAQDLYDIHAFDKVARLLAIDMEKMRLALKPNLYRVEPVYRDDNTLLWNFNAPTTVDERETVVREKFELKQREMDPAQAERMRKVEVDQRRRTHYPEWDFKAAALREDWATVIEPPATPKPNHSLSRASSRTGLRLRGLERIPDRSIRIKRLEEGDELDLNAAIDSVVHRRTRQAPDPRIFRRHGRRRRSTAVVLLMDLSHSTKRFVPGSFVSVLEVEKRAASLVAQSLDPSRDRVAVHGFSSNGRQEVNYICIKDFDEPFGPHQRSLLHSQEGRLSTRMGAALRHASRSLEGEDADHKVILLLTDGEPSDVDVFEEDYLVEDTRHAVTGAAAQGIKTFCLTLDRHADHYVRRIFGMRNYMITDKADSFAGRAGQALVRLIAQRL